MTKKLFGACAKSLILVAVVGLFAACATKPKKNSSKDQAKGGKAAAESAEPAYTPGVDVTEASLRGGSEFAAAGGLAPVLFEYDSSSLKGAALETLKKNAEYLKANPEMEFLVAGHCDERGTVEYNLALGQKRAREVREYYMRLGVPGKSMATISYGEETPACAEATEDCWAQNRRAETRVRTRTVANGKSHSRSAQ